jgi:hypothetical protein
LGVYIGLRNNQKHGGANGLPVRREIQGIDKSRQRGQALFERLKFVVRLSGAEKDTPLAGRHPKRGESGH